MHEGKKLTTAMVNKFIKAKEYDKLVAVIPAAEKYNVAPSLIRSTCKKAGEYLITQQEYDKAIVIINKTRARDVKDKTILQLFINAVSKFFNSNVAEFSKKDLAEFKQTILPIIEFHKLKYLAHRKIVESTEHMFRRIDYRIKYEAKDVKESKVTYRVQQIKNSLYGDMTIEEVRQEFARLIVPKLREMLEKEEDSKEEKKDTKRKPKQGKKDKKKKKD